MRNLIVPFIAISFVLALGQHRLAGQEATPPTEQPARMPHGRVEHELQRMRETLNVTDDQVAKIRPILETRINSLKTCERIIRCPKGKRGQSWLRSESPPGSKSNIS